MSSEWARHAHVLRYVRHCLFSFIKSLFFSSDLISNVHEESSSHQFISLTAECLGAVGQDILSCSETKALPWCLHALYQWKLSPAYAYGICELVDFAIDMTIAKELRVSGQGCCIISAQAVQFSRTFLRDSLRTPTKTGTYNQLRKCAATRDTTVLLVHY